MASHQIAQGIAQLGRHGDSTLVHMQPHEVAGLQALAKANGTSLTINPNTGLPEAFSLGGFFSSLLPTIAGFGAAAAFPEYALMAGIAAGAGTGALTNKKNPLMGAVMGGLGGYGGYGINNALQAAGSAGTGAIAADASKGMTDTLAKSGISMSDPIVRDSVTQELMRSGVGADEIANIMKYGPMTGEQAATAAQTAANVGSHGALTTNASRSFGDSLSNAWGGAKNLVSGDQAAWDATRQAIAGAGAKPAGNMSVASTFGMPLVGGVLGGLEPTDIYGNPITPGQNPNEKYDPYKTLNLNTNTGLKLYAQGGPVSFADGGDSNKKELSLDPANLPGGGAEAMRGAGMVPLDVADINAKYGYNPAVQGNDYSNLANGFRVFNPMASGLRQSTMPSVQAPVLGMFASNDQIEAARSAYESQLAAAMSGRGGMGSTANAAQVGRSMGTLSGGPAAATTTRTGIAGLGSMGSTADTAPTASTAETALSRLNINKKYADGGYVASDMAPPPVLSQDGYGLGRLNAMANGGVASYAEGGTTRVNLAEDSGIKNNTQNNTIARNSFGGVGTSPFHNYQMPANSAFGSSSFADMMGMMRYYGLPTGFGGGHNIDNVNKLNLNTDTGLGYAKGGYLDGPGDGMSDSIPATIEGRQPARLADGEFVIPADVVSHLGNGSTKAGSQRLYGMLDKVRKARTGTKKQGKQINPNKYMPA